MGPFDDLKDVEELNFEGNPGTGGCVCDFYCEDDCDCLCHEWDEPQ